MSPNTPPHISDDGELENPFWRYSLRVYEREVVREACLDLQRAYGADVNIILFLCWRAATAGRAVTKAELGAMKDAIAPLNAQVIHPLRAARDWLKDSPTPGARTCRNKVLSAELAGEQMAQAVLFALIEQDQYPSQPERVPSDVARRNLALYLDDLALEAKDIARARELVEDIVSALLAPSSG